MDRISPQVERIYVLDNGSDHVDRLEDLPIQYPNTVLIRSTENRGVAGGLNRIFKAASRDGYDLVLTLDADTICGRDLVRRQMAVFRQIAAQKGEKTVGLIGAIALNDKALSASLSPLQRWKQQIQQRMRQYFGVRTRFRKQPAYEEVPWCITAGSLTSVAAWEKVGGFDESMFIDFVDIEFCIRLRKAGCRVVRAGRARVLQRFGEATSRICFLPLPLYRFNYPPERIYYSVRNQCYCMRKHADYLDVRRQNGTWRDTWGSTLFLRKTADRCFMRSSQGCGMGNRCGLPVCHNEDNETE